jgi:site-specific DNA recombinase
VKYRRFSILLRTFTDHHITHHKKLNRGELPRFAVQGTHPRIIDDDLHHRVETERERRRQIGVVRWRGATCFTGKLICGYCNHTFTYTPVTKKSELTQFQQGQYKCSNKRKHGVKSCHANNLSLYTLRQICGKVIGPLTGDPDGTPIKPAWIEDHVKQIVVFYDTLEFHVKTGPVISVPWKNTAKRDLWAYHRTLKNQNNEVPS